MGEVPDWYDHIKAAQYLKVAPWDLLAQPIIWRDWATAATNAEAAAQKAHELREQRKS